MKKSNQNQLANVLPNQELVKNALGKQTATLREMRKPGGISGLFLTKSERTANRAELDVYITELANNKEKLLMAHEAEKQSMKEWYNSYLIKVKTTLRGDQAAHVEARLNDLLELTEQQSFTIIERLDKALERLTIIKNDTLREHQQSFIMNNVERYHETVDSLIENFNNIVQEIIK